MPEEAPTLLPGDTAPAPTARPNLTPRTWAGLFALLAVAFGLVLAIGVPPMQDFDAAAHLVRIERIAHGHLVEHVSADGDTVVAIDGCTKGFIEHHTRRGARRGAMSFADNWTPSGCVRPGRWGIRNTAVNAPVAYVGPALGWSAAAAVTTRVDLRYLGARLGGLALYIAVVAAALLVAPRGHALLLVVGLLPSSLAEAAALSADGQAISLALLAVALVLSLREAPAPLPRRGLAVRCAALAVTLLLLALTKNTYWPFLLLVLLVPVGRFRQVRSWWAYAGSVLLVGGAVTGAWLAYAGTINIAYPGQGVDSFAQRSYLVDHPFSFPSTIARTLVGDTFWDHTFRSAFEVLGGIRPGRITPVFGDLPPWWLAVAATFLVGWAVVAGRRTAARPAVADEREGGPAPATVATRRWQAWPWTAGLAVVVLAASAVLVFYGVYLAASQVGGGRVEWLQGRYFLPLVPLLLLVVRPSRRPMAPRWAQPAALAGSAFLLVWVSVRVVQVFYS